MLQPSNIAAGFDQHEEIFLARYTSLRAWALQLTENDRERAEDLVHDLYIQLTFTKPDLNAIGNLDGYLYAMLRNLHLSQVRRATRLRHRPLSIVDYDSAEIGLRAADPREQIRLQDELREVCRYACMRKETSKAGSVLILRFLHGYYPREIALLMRSTRAAVEERLRLARAEARQYLKNPQSLRFLRDSREGRKRARTGFARKTDEFLLELRETIFGSRTGECLSVESLERLYGETDASGVDQQVLGHVVSCPRCLDEINRLLNLPLLSERFPTDTLGTDTSSRGGGSVGGGGGGGGGGDDSGGMSAGAFEDEIRRCRRRARDVFEHRPAELCISVNGYLMAAQKIGSELSEQTLSLNVAEKISFIEVFSEQDIRLLFVGVEEQAQHEALQRSVRVELSDERTLEATLSFGHPWPTLQVVYSDPLMKEEKAAGLIGAQTVGALPALAQAASPSEDEDDSQNQPRSSRALSAIAHLLRSLISPGFWLRPGAITALVALVFITALLLTRRHAPTPTATDLLNRSTLAEQALAGNQDLVLHRTVHLEERRARGGDLLARRRIEVWHSAAHGLKLRRIYDEQNALIAGEWTRSDGTSTVYHHGRGPQARTAPDVAARAILETSELWRLDASAKGFSALVGHADRVVVEERGDAYVLNYQSEASKGAGKLLRATLTLNKADLRAIEQTLVVEREGEAREYRFVEAGFEQRPAATVSPEVFQPETELLGPIRQGKNESTGTNAAGDSRSSGTTGAQPSEAVASTELEIEVTYLLNQIKANLGEQVSMTRTTGGLLRVVALVETEGRKEEILRALGPVARNPAVKIEVSTVAEAVKRQPSGTKARELTVREIEVANNRLPADAELRAYFSARLVGGEAIDQEINRYASRVMTRSRQALLRASALIKLVRRFSPAEMRALAPEAQSKWLSMIREHAQAYQREVAALKQELRAVFNGFNAAAGDAVSEANLAQSAERLLQLSYATDEAVRSAFTISAEGGTSARIKSEQFWRSLAAAEKLALAIPHVYRK
jgi:RNA polymerase sigma factor (sigma-70 family)